MTYVHDRSKNPKTKQSTVLDRGFGIEDEAKKRAVATDYVIDVNKRGKDGSTGKEPRMKDQNRNIYILEVLLYKVVQ